MKKAHRTALAEVRDIVEPHGLQCVLSGRGRHSVLLVTGILEERPIRIKFAISGTPRSGAENAGDWARQKIRRKLIAKGMKL